MSPRDVRQTLDLTLAFVAKHSSLPALADASCVAIGRVRLTAPRA